MTRIRIHRLLAASLSASLAASALASPTDDFVAGDGFAINMIYASGTVSGWLSFPVEFHGEGWTEVAKQPGSLSGSLDLNAIAPELGLNAQGLLVATILGPTQLKWKLTAPSLIDQYVDVEIDGVSYHVKVKSVDGTLTANALARFPMLDPVVGGYRNVDLVKDESGTNSMVVKGQLNGSFLFPVTVTLDHLEYEGLAGFGPIQTVSGNIVLGDFLGSPEGRSAVIEVREPGASAPAETHAVTLDAQGGYTFATTLWGPHDLRAKVGHWTAQLRPGVNLDGSRTAEDFALANGDVDGDNVVTVFDYNALSDAFDSAEGDPSWNPMADLDGDRVVTVFDYNILSSNFDRSGDA